ncbi:MAG: site-2 protease family protein [Candidatus Thorarchaeota archaeon]|nr:site-2 protease family protein [Candidatus Thorarchaeota archaeon]
MDPVVILWLILMVYIVAYIVARAIGLERLGERGLDANTPLAILIRTQRLNSVLTRVGKRMPQWVFNVGIIIGFVGMVGGFYLFLDNLVKFFILPEEAGGVVPIIPGVTVTGLPVIYIIIGLAITLLTHEFAHGLALSRDDIPIKSSGILFFFVFFGGFVEPDDEVFEQKASRRARMRVLAAGSFSNMVWAFVFFLLLSNYAGLMSIGFNPPNGAYVYQISPGSPAENALQVGDVIVALNGTEIDTWAELSVFMNSTRPNTLLNIATLRGNFSIVLSQATANSTRGYIGIYGADYWEPKQGWEWIPGGAMYAFHVQQVLVWTFIILFSVALFNLLPIPALDGDKLLSNGLGLITDNDRLVKMIMNPIRLFALLIVVLSIVLTFMTGKSLF